MALGALANYQLAKVATKPSLRKGSTTRPIVDMDGPINALPQSIEGVKKVGVNELPRLLAKALIDVLTHKFFDCKITALLQLRKQLLPSN